MTQLKVGDRVQTTRARELVEWQKCFGTVTGIRKSFVTVRWDGYAFEDERHISNVELIPECARCHDVGVVYDQHHNAGDFCNCERGKKLVACYPLPTTSCKRCWDTGVLYDTVDYGSTTVSMPSNCDCALGMRQWALVEPEEAYKGCQENE